MSKKIYVGNLPFSTTQEEIHRLFSQYGTVESVSLITDRESGKPRGFGFVEMADVDADRAIVSISAESDDEDTLSVYYDPATVSEEEVACVIRLLESLAGVAVKLRTSSVPKFTNRLIVREARPRSDA